MVELSLSKSKIQTFRTSNKYYCKEQSLRPPRHSLNLRLRGLLQLGIGGKGKRATGVYEIEYLPLTTQKGQPCVYPEDRLVADFLKFNQKVYILKDSLFKMLCDQKVIHQTEDEQDLIQERGSK